MLTNDYYTNRNSITIKQKSDDDNNTDADMITVSNFSTYLVKELSETNIIYSFSEGFYDLYFLLIYWRNLVDVAAVFYYWLTQRYWKKKHELHQSFSLIWDIKYYIYFKKNIDEEYILLPSFSCLGNVYYFYPNGECLYCWHENQFNSCFITILKWWINYISKIIK